MLNIPLTPLPESSLIAHPYQFQDITAMASTTSMIHFLSPQPDIVDKVDNVACAQTQYSRHPEAQVSSWVLPELKDGLFSGAK